MTKPTKEDLKRFARIRELGCYIGNHFSGASKDCGGDIVVHHQLGCVRDHRRCMPLCHLHHSATSHLPFGNSVHKGTRSFEAKYTTQEVMVEWTNRQLELNDEK